jgi:tRNA threonylcarbamoyl adenosine modification protein YeaZ
MVLGVYTASGVEIALSNGNRAVSETSTGGALESLLSLIEQALKRMERTLGDLSMIGVCTGPGSFTGLRIGVAFSKSLAQARDLPIFGIPTYDVEAFAIDSYPLVCVARGKPGYYYAKVIELPHMSPSYVQGERMIVEQAADAFVPRAKIVGTDFLTNQPGDHARAVVELAAREHERGARSHWTNIAIDYGQRPNAVINWEQRSRARKGG